MALTINTNISSLMVQLSLKQSSLELDRALQQMTTGYRINSAKDDAAGYAVATKMAIDLSSYNVVQNNTMLGTSLLSTATSSLDLVTTHLQRIRDLAEQAANGTYGTDSITAIQAEIDQRTQEINRVMSSTEYNGIKLFEGDGTANITGEFISQVNQLTEEQALAQGYTLIKTADDLNNIRNNLSGKYILMNDIDLSSYSNWQPIGDFDMNTGSGDIFTGELNGNGHVIKNLNINRPTEDNVALIVATTGKIQNIGLENIFIHGNISVSGLVSFSNGGFFSNCYVSGVIEGIASVGGVTSLAYFSNYEDTYFYGDVSGDSYVGGLIGQSFSEINNCYSTGSVSGSYIAAGGLIGMFSGNIKNSYSNSNVNGNAGVGGLLGVTLEVSTMDSCYAAGKVSGISSLGGLIGEIGNDFTISNSYNIFETTEQTNAIGAISNGTLNGLVNTVTTTELNSLIGNGILPQYTPTNAGGSSGRTFTLQVGIDSTENSKITFDTALGFTLNIDVSTTANAQNALDEIDEVLDLITAKQTEFGAVQNRLDSVLDSLNVSIQNTTSSLSTIRDADIAKVSADYIRAQILQQASASLLATANQAPSIALNLI